MRRKEVVIVLVLILLGLVLRCWRINTDLLIHYDQGRDLLAAASIWRDHKLTLLGPASDGKDIFFGPLYYYLIAVPLMITGGDPVAASVLLIILEMISLWPLYLGIKKIVGKKIALWSLVFMVTSYGMVSFSRWLSNAMPVLALGNLLVYCLVFDKERWWWLVLGLIFAFNPAAGIGIFLFGLWKWGKRRMWGSLFVDLIVFLLPSVPQLLFDLRHDFLITRGVLSLITKGGGGSWSMDPAIVINQFLSIIWGYGSYGIGALGFWVVIGAWWLRRGKIDKQWRELVMMSLIQMGIMFLFRRQIFTHFYMSIAPIMVMALVDGLLFLGKKWGVFLVAILIGWNCWLDVKNFTKPGLDLTPIGTANLVTIENRLKIVDFAKKEIGNDSYSWFTYNIPYEMDQVWRYLFWWRGIKSEPVEKGSKLVLIYERDWDRPDRLNDWLEEKRKIGIKEEELKVVNFGVEVIRFREKEKAKISWVFDGDTVRLSDGRLVRYIGIDTPEVSSKYSREECFGEEAKEENMRLVLGKWVELEKDRSDVDKYGRLLRYVWVDGMMINEYLVSNGWARVDRVEPDVEYADKLEQGEEIARGKKMGWWSRCK